MIEHDLLSAGQHTDTKSTEVSSSHCAIDPEDENFEPRADTEKSEEEEVPANLVAKPIGHGAVIRRPDLERRPGGLQGIVRGVFDFMGGRGSGVMDNVAADRAPRGMGRGARDARR